MVWQQSMKYQILLMQAMNKHPGLPRAEIYEQEYKYWPWGKLINYTFDWLISHAPSHSNIIDYMCGTGFLLNQLGTKRVDVSLYGCSITEEFIDYAQKNYKNINVQLKDALDYTPVKKPNIVIATGGIHHLEYSKQKIFVRKVASELSTNGIFIIGEELIETYSSSVERNLSVLKLSSALIEYIIKNNSPKQVLEAALELQSVDMFEQGEYKLTINMLKELVTPYFNINELVKIWPDDSKSFGDYVLICKKK